MAHSAESALTVFAWGNTCRGDDAIGPLIAEYLRDGDTPGLHIIEDHQLNIEHVTDLADAGAALFIDASVAVDAGCKLERIAPSKDGNFSTHAISPQALLNVYEKTLGKPPPESWMLHIAARDFELGAEPGDVARQALTEARHLLAGILEQDPGLWRDRLSTLSAN